MVLTPTRFWHENRLVVVVLMHHNLKTQQL